MMESDQTPRQFWERLNVIFYFLKVHLGDSNRQPQPRERDKSTNLRHDVWLLAAEEVTVGHGLDGGPGSVLPGPHGRGPLLNLLCVLLDRGGTAPVRVPLAEHRVHSASKHLKEQERYILPFNMRIRRIFQHCSTDVKILLNFLNYHNILKINA